MTQPERRRIAYLVNQYPAISHTFIREEIAALEGLGFDVLRIAVRGWDADLRDAQDTAEIGRTHYLLQGGIGKAAAALARSLLGSPVRTLKAARLALQLSKRSDRSAVFHLMYLAEACLALTMVKRNGSQHIHAHFGSNAAEVAMLVSALSGIPFSFTIHGPEEFDKADQLHLAKKVDAAAFVAAVSSFGRSQILRRTKAESWSKVHIVHCGLGAAYLDVVPSDVPDSRRLVCIGRLCEQKGQTILVRACRILASRGMVFEVVLVGDGDMRGEIEREIERLQVHDQVKLAGWRNSEEIRSLLTNSRGLVLPSFAEGLPVVIMEAMALGRPVISTYVAGIPELLRDGEEGFLVPAGNEVDLADAMQRLLTLGGPDLRRLGENARARVKVRHSAITEAAKLAAHFGEYDANSSANVTEPI